MAHLTIPCSTTKRLRLILSDHGVRHAHVDKPVMMDAATRDEPAAEGKGDKKYTRIQDVCTQYLIHKKHIYIPVFVVLICSTVERVLLVVVVILPVKLLVLMSQRVKRTIYRARDIYIYNPICLNCLAFSTSLVMASAPLGHGAVGGQTGQERWKRPRAGK